MRAKREHPSEDPSGCGAPRDRACEARPWGPSGERSAPRYARKRERLSENSSESNTGSPPTPMKGNAYRWRRVTLAPRASWLLAEVPRCARSRATSSPDAGCEGLARAHRACRREAPWVEGALRGSRESLQASFLLVPRVRTGYQKSAPCDLTSGWRGQDDPRPTSPSLLTSERRCIATRAGRARTGTSAFGPASCSRAPRA